MKIVLPPSSTQVAELRPVESDVATAFAKTHITAAAAATAATPAASARRARSGPQRGPTTSSPGSNSNRPRKPKTPDPKEAQLEAQTYDPGQRMTSPTTSPTESSTLTQELATPAAPPTPTPPPNRTLRDWHPDEQPRERLMQHGAEALATSELLAILLRSGTPGHSAVDIARELLHRCDGHLRGLSRLKYQDLADAHGIGPAKAVTLVAALELGKRWTMEADRDAPLMIGSKASYDLVAPLLRDLPHEECWALLTNNASRLIARERISSGSVDGTIVDVRSVMACALRHNASGFVVAHNHPSHSLNPSQADIHLTNTLSEASKLMNLKMQDHIIVAGNRYYSFRDSKLLV